MIRINLLPPELRKKRIPRIIDVTLVYVVFVIILFSFLLNFITVQQKNKISSIERKIEKTKAEIAHYQEIINLVSEIEKVRNTINTRVTVIQELEKKRFLWVNKLVELANNVPDYLWLSSMYEEKDKVSLKGSSFSIKSIATFIVQLLKNKVFDSVSLAFIKESYSDFGKTYYFEMSTKFAALVPAPQPPPQEAPKEEKKEGITAKIRRELGTPTQ
ncbi:MAG: PilN domain-containing protein [bacterium]